MITLTEDEKRKAAAGMMRYRRLLCSVGIPMTTIKGPLQKTC